MSKPPVCITAALLYANGPVHLGHLVEYIQADIAARYFRLAGHPTHYLCGNDVHGTAIMLAAQKADTSPEELVNKIHTAHGSTMSGFSIEFDHFNTTHDEYNRELAAEIFEKLDAKGDILRKNVMQAVDPDQGVFLPDRYVKGNCPRCDAPDQYGDNCEVCSATYSPSELKNPKSVLSGKTPEQKETEHLFLDINRHKDFLLTFLKSGAVPTAAANKLMEWFDEDLRPWDISRDAPYFGFEIPNHPNKYFYVWFDAPIGYMACHRRLCEKNGTNDFSETWQPESKTRLIQFIGKDILYFHALFWPTLLKQGGYRLPNELRVHGYLTIDNQKMSKSRGTFITAQHYLKSLDPEYLRYYYAAKLSDHIEDIDLNLSDFKARVNSDLVGKFINIASRCAGFIRKHFDGKLSAELPEPALFQQAVDAGASILSHYDAGRSSHAMREIMQVADLANQYIDLHKPWTLAKESPVPASVQEITTQGINLFKVLATYLKPVLPTTVEKIETFLNIPPLDFAQLAEPLLDHQINTFKPLLSRITDDALDALQQESV